MKTQLQAATSEIDLQRIRSAFNCQAPGHETLSAEQIVVEHAVSQVKSALSCTAPDTEELHSQEEVIEPWEDHRSTAGITADSQEESTGLAGLKPVSVDHAVADAAHQVRKEPMDLLDSADALPADTPVIEASEEYAAKAAVDLLDLSDAVPAQVKTEAAGPETPDLLNLSDSIMPEAPAAATFNQEPSGVPNDQQRNILDIVDLTLGQTPQQVESVQAVHELVDLLDLSEQPSKASPAVKGFDQQVPTPFDIPELVENTGDQGM